MLSGNDELMVGTIAMCCRGGKKIDRQGRRPGGWWWYRYIIKVGSAISSFSPSPHPLKNGVVDGDVSRR